MKKLLPLILGCIVALPAAAIANVTMSQTMVNEPGLTYSNTYYVNLNDLGGIGSARNLAVQVTYSSVTMSPSLFTDGTQSTAAITVNSNNILAQAATNQITVPSTALILGAPATAQMTINSLTGLGSGATAQITILSNGFLGGEGLTIKGANTVTLLNGVQWATGYASSNTATNLAAAINLYTSQTGLVAGTTNWTTIYCTATVNGSAGLAYAVTPSSIPLISTTAFSGGTANAYINANGNILTNGNQWTAQSTASGTALAIANAINLYAGTQLTAATTGWTTIYATADVNGIIGNSFTWQGSNVVAISTTVWTGGLNPALLNAWINFNGDLQYNGDAWNDQSQTSTGTAISIANWLNSEKVIVATAPLNSSVVYATATTAGIAGNSYTLTVSTTNLVVPSGTFLNGQSNAVITINGVPLTAGVSFSTGAATTNTATSLAAAINNVTATAGVVANAAGSIVTTTSTAVGVAANYALTSSTQAALTWSPGNMVTTAGASKGTMTGGTNAGTTIGSAVIVSTNNFTKAYPVLYSSGTPLSPLVTGTTYYIIPISTNAFQLATTSTGAVAGAGIVITSSSSQTTAHTFNVTPLAPAGLTASALWQVSNDAFNWVPLTISGSGVAVSSNTFTPVYPSTTTIQDWGSLDYQYLRYNITTSTTAAVNLKVIINSKD